MPFQARWDGGGLLAGWRDLFGRQESSRLPGGQKLCVCRNMWPLPRLWTSGASDTGSGAERGLLSSRGELQSEGGGSRQPKVQLGPRH